MFSGLEEREGMRHRNSGMTLIELLVGGNHLLMGGINDGYRIKNKGYHAKDQGRFREGRNPLSLFLWAA